jgi:hypothetical protein
MSQSVDANMLRQNLNERYIRTQFSIDRHVLTFLVLMKIINLSARIHGFG